MRTLLLLSVLSLCACAPALPTGPTHKEDGASPARRAALKAVAEDYQARVLPLMDPRCLDCHATAKRFPAYHAWPLVGRLIDMDIAESRAVLDMQYGFPFGGPKTTEEDLADIARLTVAHALPPRRYRFLHKGATMTPAEEAVVIDWAERSKALLAAAH